MTDNPTPAQSDEEQLVHVGWWCWRGNGHGHLATMACKSDNVPLHVPAEWADEMRAVIQRIEDGDDEDESPAPRSTAAPTVWVDGHPQLEAIAFAVWEKCERSDSGLTIDDPRNIAVAALSAVQPLLAAPAGLGVSATPSHTDQAFVLWLDASDGSVPTHDGIVWPDGTATIHHRHFGHTTTHADAEAARQAVHGKQGRIVWPEPVDRAAVLRDLVHKAEEWDGHITVQELRRLADEAQQQPTDRDVVEAHDAALSFTLKANEAPEPEPSVHGESVAHLAGLHDGRDAWADDEQRQGATCTNCRGSGLDPRCNGEFDCPDCTTAVDARQDGEA